MSRRSGTGKDFNPPERIALSQSGSTYTMQSSFRLCNGKQVVDKIVVTVQPTRLLYAHTYLRPGIADKSMLTGRGRVIHGGKGLVVAQSEVCNEEGKQLVVASGSFMRRDIRDWIPVT